MLWLSQPSLPPRAYHTRKHFMNWIVVCVRLRQSMVRTGLTLLARVGGSTVTLHRRQPHHRSKPHYDSRSAPLRSWLRARNRLVYRIPCCTQCEVLGLVVRSVRTVLVITPSLVGASKGVVKHPSVV